jgi:ribosomal protein S18 acetylase RimI-like enzyme
MLYRLYKPADFAQLYAIEVACFEPPFRFSQALVRELTRDAHSAAWVAEEDGHIAGFAIADLNQGAKSKRAYIQTIEVLAERRGAGIGGELLRRVEDSARGAEVGTIWLHVDTENPAAIRLYEAHGYKRQRKAENFYPRSRAAYVYCKTLEPEAA